MKAKVRNAVTVEAEKSPEVPSEVANNPLYGVAILKIAMEMKRPNAPDLDQILRGVLARMSLSEDALRKYLEQNTGLLQAIASRRSY